jgi:chromosome partitioning protein
MLTLTIGGVHKGGVGKTTCAVTVGHGLALAGYRVLIVDLDSQGHVAYYLGIDRKPAIHHLLKDRAPVRDCVTVARPPNLAIIPSDQSTAKVEKDLVSMRFRELRLKQALEPLQQNAARDRAIDFAILDTAPGVGALHDAAMAASDYVLAVVEAATASLDGLALLTHTIAEFQAMGHSLGLLGIVPTMIDDRTIASSNAVAALKEAEPDLAPVYPGIHRATVFQRSVADGKTIWEMDPETRSRPAREYSAVIRQLLEDLK